MIEGIDVKASLKSGKIKWNGASLFFRHSRLLVVIIGCTVITSMGAVEQGLVGFKITLVFCLVLLLLTIYAVRKNARLTATLVNNPPLHFKPILETYLNSSRYNIYRSNQQYLTALKPGKWMVGVGVAILYHKNSIFVNVQNDEGYGGYFPFSFGQNKKITDHIIQVIKTADNNN